MGERLFAQLQEAVLQPSVVEYAVQEFAKQLDTALASKAGETTRLRDRKTQVEGELEHLVAAVAATGHSTVLLQAISERERELRELSDKLLTKPGAVHHRIDDLRSFVATRLVNIARLLNTDVERARTELAKHVTQITMTPQTSSNGAHYIATGEWNLLGGYTGRVRLVAGGGFEPPTFGL